MIHFDADWLWLIPIALQATETLASNSNRLPREIATMARIQDQVNMTRRVAAIVRATKPTNWLYFIPVALSRSVKLVINVSKSLTLKVFGTGQ